MTKAGIQVSSLKAYLQTPEDVRSTFQKLAAMGCRFVQLQWIHPEISPEFIAGALRETGLVSVSTQDYYDTVLKDLPNVLRLHALCGSSHLCVSGIPERYRSHEGCLAFAAELTALTKQLEAQGLRLSFHPRSQEYDRFAAPGEEGVPAMRVLMEHTPDSMYLGLDLYHVLKAKLDPVQWIQDYQGRIDFVHFKDKAVSADGEEYLTPVGQGDTDWTPIIRACRKAQIPWAFAEQERWQKDAFVCMQESFDWMLQQGFAAK